MKKENSTKSINSDAKISIVVPVYNTQDYLRHCVDSILSNTYPNYEVILIDDGSTDDSPKIADEYAEQDVRVRAVHIPNGGVSSARNLGIEKATGDFICFVDSDDWVEPTYLEKLVKPLLEDSEIDISICGWYVHRNDQIFLGTDRGLGRLSSEDAISEVLNLSRGFHGYLWNKMFRAELFQSEPKLRLDTDIHICEDLLLCIKAFLSGATAYDNQEPLYHYLYRENGALRTINDKRMSEFVARERIAEMLSDKKNLYYAAELAHVKTAFNLLYVALETGNSELKSAMLKRIDARLLTLLQIREISLSERGKLIIRRIFPKWSMRIFQRMQNNDLRRKA